MKIKGIVGESLKASVPRLLGAGLLLLVVTVPLDAQVSALAQVQLVATRLPEAAFVSAMRPRVVTHRGAIAEALASVVITANTTYRLVVHRVSDGLGEGDSTAGRIWVQTGDGEFHQLTLEQPVVAYTHRGPDDGVPNRIRFRVEKGGSDASAFGEVPVRYDLVVEPTL